MDKSKTGKDFFDRKMVAELYEENSDALYRYAYRYLGDQDLAEECVADVFMHFIKRVQTETSYENNFRAYLYRSAHNWIVDRYRSGKHTLLQADEEIPDSDTNVEEGLLQQIKVEKLKKALMRLPEEQRMVIELRYMENWSHKEVSSFLGKTVEATRALQHRSMVTLREWMSID
jgi:RNA polymerase sigma-70 factor (ECF subfamily)